MRTPEEIVKDLAPAYQEWKGGEKAKNKYKTEFFDSITASVSEDDLAEEIVTVDKGDAKASQQWVEKQYPAWEVTDSRENPEGKGWEFIIRQLPEYLPFNIEFGGKVWGRQIASGSTFLDDEAICHDDPSFYMEVTEFPREKEREELLLLGNADLDAVEIYEILEYWCNQRNEGRILKNLDDLTPEQLARLQPYTYEGKPTVKLPAPKRAEDSEK